MTDRKPSPAARKKSRGTGLPQAENANPVASEPKKAASKAGKCQKRPIPVTDVEIPSRETPKGIVFDGLNEQQSEFVRQFVIHFNGTAAAKRAGYSGRSAYSTAGDLLKKPEVRAAIELLLARHAEKMDVTVEALVKRWQSQFNADHNELTQYRRVPCRHCWGEGHVYQYTPGEFQKAKLRHEEKRAELLGKSGGKSDIGEFPGVEGDWYDKRLEPNIECPDCFGDGEGETFFADTRKLSEKGKAIYAGVKETKDGIEIKTVSTEKAGEYLARYLGAFNDSLKVDVVEMTKEALEQRFVERMNKARQRQAEVLAERGIQPD